jgi:hypothetical protein
LRRETFFSSFSIFFSILAIFFSNLSLNPMIPTPYYFF